MSMTLIRRDTAAAGSPRSAAAGAASPVTALFALAAALVLTACGGGGGGGAEPVGPLVITSEATLANAGALVFRIAPSAPFDGDTIVKYRTADLPGATGAAVGGAACGAGIDYVSISETPVTFNSTGVSVAVTLCSNTGFEPSEQFQLVAEWAPGIQRGNGVILNNAPGGITDTGITQCLNNAAALVACSASDIAGQDGSRGRDATAATSGNADGRVGFAYADAAGGCIEDRVTGLVWDSNAPAAATQGDAGAQLAAANVAARCGFSDWRLPTVAELMTLVDAGAAAAPRIDARFAGTPSAAFWTSNLYIGDPRAAWVVDFNSGAAAFEAVANPLAKAAASRLVRGTTPLTSACDDAAVAHLVDHGNGTVTDSRTGLMWQQCSDGLSGAGCATGAPAAYASFATAMGRATAVNVDVAGAGRGHADWRVPNRNELASLINRACEAPAIQRAHFPGTRSVSYWSSSAAGAGRAWYVDFNDGSVGPGGTTGDRLLRLVRAGQ